MHTPITAYSPGYLAQQLQISVREIRSELDTAGFCPVLLLNDLEHWGPDALAHLRRHRRRLSKGLVDEHDEHTPAE